MIFVLHYVSVQNISIITHLLYFSHVLRCSYCSLTVEVLLILDAYACIHTWILMLVWRNPEALRCLIVLPHVWTCSACDHSFHASFIYILSYDLILQRTAHVFLERSLWALSHFIWILLNIAGEVWYHFIWLEQLSKLKWPFESLTAVLFLCLFCLLLPGIVLLTKGSLALFDSPLCCSSWWSRCGSPDVYRVFTVCS